MSADADAAGTLFVIATPIGNVADLSPRARTMLESVDLVLAEDTRHTGALLARLGIDKPLRSLHEHNEAARVDDVLERLRAGARVALVSDAGTPLVSDPGYRLLAAVRASGLRASPIPGPCAAVAALSVAGLPTDRFCFEGFLPARASARRERLDALRDEARTLVFHETVRRLPALLGDMSERFGATRRATIARELTKAFEELRHGTLAELEEYARGAGDRLRGEIVLVVEGSATAEPPGRIDAKRVLQVLLDEVPPGQAARLAAGITGAPRNDLYELALTLRGGKSAD
jgi:16S rRNA (cytidine1402-2'-O)-methyltransferase